jgi:cytochrome c556
MYKNLRLHKLAIVAIGALAAGIAIGAEDPPPEHQKWMKDLGNQMGALRKGVDVEKNAADMHTVMKEVTMFWSKRPSDVAVKSSNDTTAGAAEIIKGAQAGDKATISAGMKMVGAGCKGCHDIHREKISDTVYKIK